ncbi:MAG TPA: phospholipase D-like domain-containing protein [Bacteroidia bacterium]|jgi:phosphatidylserine/phosphatidylglycerophosphate/cardiolipin synthase-like enzyme|nr:phospholipase D-like domain-containing protein [Bacteroidia bacterium]
MKKTATLLLAFLIYVSANAQLFGPNHHIIVYSTHAVDTTVERPHNRATALIRIAGDTLIQYINRAKYTIDIALYDFVEDSLWYEGGYVPPIHVAINNAYKRGVKIRWLSNPTDSSLGFTATITPQYGLDSINKAIPTFARTDTKGIMHNKFMIIDGLSTNKNDAIVWTGSMNWEPGQICKDINNIIIFQDSALAHAYLDEFNQMWGNTTEGAAATSSKAVFGANKKNNSKHSSVIDGHLVEVWFSPQANDSTSNHIVSVEKSAKSEIDFEMFTFTYSTDASPLVTANSGGIKVYGIMDQASLTYSPYTTLSSAMGANLLVYKGLPGYDSNGICHSKYMITDPCDMVADPKVLTGSHNWSSSAETANDENTVIVHDSSVANQFYQAFHADFLAVSGAAGKAINLTHTCTSAPLAVNEIHNADRVTLFPNPATNSVKVTLNFPGNNVLYSVYDVTGKIVASGKLDARYVNTIDVSSFASGIYLMRVTSNADEYSCKFVKQ